MLEPERELSASIDYCMIDKLDVISDLSEQVILGNLSKYEESYAKRDEFGEFIDTNLLQDALHNSA